ncbi:MAG: orotidine-5'-phosphate decarboxylase [bacterium]
MKEQFIRGILNRKLTTIAFRLPIIFKIGLPSPVYGDYRSVFSYPELREMACEMMYDSLERTNIDVVYGVSEGALSAAAVFAHVYGLDYGFIRKDAKVKDYGLGKLIEGASVAGRDVLLIEDLVTSGSSVINNALILLKSGARSVTIRVLFSYDMAIAQKEFQEAGLSYKALITVYDVMPYLKEILSVPEYDSLEDWLKDSAGWFERHKLEFQFGFLTDLRISAERTGSLICAGIDPVLESLPAGRTRSIAGFAAHMEDVFSEMKAQGVPLGMIKPNHGFYEIHNRPWDRKQEGDHALLRIMQAAKKNFPDIKINTDAKRGDIGKSSENYAQAWLGENGWRADAVTVHGYMGTDSVEPFTKFCNDKDRKGAYILCLTSNPGSKDVQKLELGNWKYVYEAMGQNIIKWAAKKPGVGAVIPGNSPKELSVLARLFAGKSIPTLLPGIGSQGGRADVVMQNLHDAKFEVELARLSVSSHFTHPWYSEKKPNAPIPPRNECIEMSVNAIKELNEQVGYKQNLPTDFLD